MIQNDLELKGTLERIAWFARLVAQFRAAALPNEFKLMSGAYLAEIEKMNAEVLEYLRHHPAEIEHAVAA